MNGNHRSFVLKFGNVRYISNHTMPSQTFDQNDSRLKISASSVNRLKAFDLLCSFLFYEHYDDFVSCSR